MVDYTNNTRKWIKMKKNKIVNLALILTFLSIFIATNVQSHSPSSIVLSYDFGTQTLDVTVSHTVSDASHYIEEIQVWKNDVSQTIETYTSQTTNSQHEDSFSISASNGDVLKVTATCNIAGSLTNQITVADPAIPEFGLYLSLAFITLLAGIFGLIVLKKRN